MTRSNIADFLIPGLKSVTALSYSDVVDEASQLYTKMSSDKAVEVFSVYDGFDYAGIVPEGQAIPQDDYQQRYKLNIENVKIAKRFSITEEALADNLYINQAKLRSDELGKAIARGIQIEAHKPFNNGFTTYKTPDGVAFFSSSHPTPAGNQSNLISGALSEAALETAMIQIMNAKDGKGNPSIIKPVSLHIPPALLPTALKITKSELSTQTVVNGSNGITNTNNINVIYQSNMFPGGIHVHRYFTSAVAWYIKTDAPMGAIWLEREPLKVRSFEDPRLEIVDHMARVRVGFGVLNWQGFYASNGS